MSNVIYFEEFRADKQEQIEHEQVQNLINDCSNALEILDGLISEYGSDSTLNDIDY